MSIAKFSVRNPVLINLVMIGIFLFGAISLLRLPRELNPEISFNWAFITVVYPGASPLDVESLIVDPLEAELKDIEDLDEMQSTSSEGYGFVMLKFKDISETKFRERMSEVQNDVDKVALPDEAEEPMVDDFSSGDFIPVISVDMSSEIPDENAHKIAEDLEEDLLSISGVAKVQVSGLAKREIWVEVDPDKLLHLGVTIDEVVLALKVRNLNIPGGNISMGKTEYLIRSLGEYQNVNEIENTVVRRLPGGRFIQIRDVARVADRREEMITISRLNGRPSMTFSVSKSKDANSVDVIDEVKKLVKTYETTVPDGIRFGLTNDNSVYIYRVLNVLRNNAISGMFFIVITLFLFLGERGLRFLGAALALSAAAAGLLYLLDPGQISFMLTFYIFGILSITLGDFRKGGANTLLAVLGILIAFAVTFIIMDFSGLSLNGNTLFALVMVVGILVDDAIIIIENAHRYRLRGFDSYQAAIRGTDEVVGPVISSIATNIAAFLPLMLLPGIMGKFMRIIPLVFSLSLIASLFEAFILLPSHYADWTTKSKVYQRGEKKFFRVLRTWYGHSLVRMIRHRYWVLGGLIIALIASFIITFGFIGVEFFPDEDFDQIKVFVKFPEGTSLDETDRIMTKFEEKALALPADQIEAVVTNVGLLQDDEEWLTKKSVAQLQIQLKPFEERRYTLNQLMDTLRAATAVISGPTSLEIQGLASGPPTGRPISIKVQGKYLDEIKAAAVALQDSIKNVKGTREVADNFPPGKKEIQIHVNEEKAALFGFNVQYVAANVRYAFDGIEATEFREGDDEIDVVVKYDKVNRSSLEDVLNLKMTNVSGQTVAMREMVDFKIQPGATEINRFDQKRTILVTGDFDDKVTKIDLVNKKIRTFFPRLEAAYPGVTFKFGGQFEEFVNIFGDITTLFALSLILIFIILGAQFNSYSQPLIILVTVPFAFIGAMLGLLISGNLFSFSAMYGFVALGGIVVNDAIVMMDFMNDRRQGGSTTILQYWRSIINSGRLRLRPIILTSLTTIAGLAPMAFGIVGDSATWSPLANVILFGLIVSTVLTLFIIPAIMAVVDDLKGSRKKAARLKA